MKKLQPPKPQQSRSSSFPSLQLRSESSKSPVYSKAFLNIVQKRSVPNNDFYFQAKPSMVFKVFTKNIISNSMVLEKPKIIEKQGKKQVFFCNFIIPKRNLNGIIVNGFQKEKVMRIGSRIGNEKV
jgi:hypothetical protein